MIVADDKQHVGTILSQTEDTLFTAKLGLTHVLGPEPKARIAGLRNVIVFGRAVTNVLQQLRSVVPSFDEWYQPYVKEMQSDPVMAFLYKVRSEVLKEGNLNIHSSARLSGDPMAIMRQFQPPPRAKAFFMGDRNGGSGWEVDVGEGKTEKYYVQLPGEIPGLRVDVNIHFSDAPAELKEYPVRILCERYFTYLAKMVGDARKRFGERS